eukprot:g8798.t1
MEWGEGPPEVEGRRHQRGDLLEPLAGGIPPSSRALLVTGRDARHPLPPREPSGEASKNPRPAGSLRRRATYAGANSFRRSNEGETQRKRKPPGGTKILCPSINGRAACFVFLLSLEDRGTLAPYGPKCRRRAQLEAGRPLAASSRKIGAGAR